MKLSLVVLTAGKWQGKSILISRSPFVIGRDPICHLRPASPLISKRHCALVVRAGKVLVRDFDSSNGTYVNGQQITGEVELRHEDHLQVGPVAFLVQFETRVPVDQPTPLPPTKAPAPPSVDDAAAALLLSWQEETSPSPPIHPVDDAGIPTGTTVLLPPENIPSEGAPTPEKQDKEKPPPKVADTASSAKAILEKYWRRPRS
jgi:pSer/pThr/pTyr-binding forkhead associated (FHA) protein